MTSPPPARTASELAAATRRAFERALLERTGQLPAQDPALGALFQATAVQLARVYAEAEQIFPEAVFDDLVAGLGQPPRPALPAQTVVQVRGVLAAERLTDEHPLVAFTPQADRVLFTPDVPVTLSHVSLAFAGVVEGGALHAVAGATLPGGLGLPVPVRRVPLEARWAGLAPALLLAFEVGDAHLAGLGLYVDTGDGDGPVTRAMARSVWHLLDARGLAHERGVLRSREGPGGVRLLGPAHAAPRAAPEAGVADAVRTRGPFGPQCFVFPERLPAALRATGRPPRAVARALAALAPPEQAGAFDRPLAWVQVQLPAEAEGAAAAVARVAVNCVAASNLSTQSERVPLGAVGEPAAHAVRLAPGRHLVRVLAVDGEQGESYAEAPPAPGAGDELARGQFRARGDALRVRPARGATGRFDRVAVACLLATDGERANAVQAGDLRQFAAPTAGPTAEVTNLTPARGGAAPPPPAPARVRFAELARTRERVVTPADVEVTARAFDPRVLGTAVEPRVEVDDAGRAARVDVVRARVDAAAFGDPGAEFVRLAAGLERLLRERSGPAARVRVRVEEAGG